jgi:hypothetical protein
MGLSVTGFLYITLLKFLPDKTDEFKQDNHQKTTACTNFKSKMVARRPARIFHENFHPSGEPPWPHPLCCRPLAVDLLQLRVLRLAAAAKSTREISGPGGGDAGVLCNTPRNRRRSQHSERFDLKLVSGPEG